MINKNPWLGLNTYAEHDRLYGRDKETEEVSDIILNNRSTVIYGRSGVGKSSLLRAGVFPRMRYEDFLPVYIRLEHNTAEGYFQQVERKIKEASADADILMTDDGGMVLTERQSGIRKYPLLVFDQFEEIFTLPDNAHKPAVAEFFSHLASLLNNREESGNAFRVVICLREDYLYFLEQNSSDIPSLKRNRYRLMPLSLGQGREVICRPLPGAVTAETADVILARIDSDCSGYVDPSILSLFMHELYEKGRGSITLDNIRLYGDNIIADFYEDGMCAVSAKTAKFLEDRLVTTDGYRHYLSYNDALAEGVTAGELDILKEKRIITVEKGEKNQRIIELSHDVLCPLVLQSRKERNLKEEADRLAAKTKAMRRRNRVMLLSLLILLILISTFIYLVVEIKTQRDKILVTQTRYVTEKAIELSENGDVIKAMALMSEVYPHDLEHPNRPLVEEAYAALKDMVGKCYYVNKIYHNALALSPDGSLLVVKDGDKFAVMDVETGSRKIVKGLDARHSASVSFSEDGERILVMYEVDSLFVMNLETGLLLSVDRRPSFSNDGGCFVEYDLDSVTILWDVESNTQIASLNKHFPNYRQPIRGYFYSPSGKWIIGSYGPFGVLWDAQTGGDELYRFDSEQTVRTVSMDVDEKYILTINTMAEINIWNVETGLKVLTKGGYYYRIWWADFSPDGKCVLMRAIIPGQGYKLILWDLSHNTEVFTRSVDNPHAFFNPDGSSIVATSNKRILIIDAKTGNEEFVFNGFKDFRSVTFDDNGNLKSFITGDSTAIVLSPEMYTRNTIFVEQRGNIRYYTFSSDGHSLFTVDEDEAVLWDTETGVKKSSIRKPFNVEQAFFNYSGDKVMMTSFGNDTIVNIWDLKTGSLGNLSLKACSSYREYPNKEYEIDRYGEPYESFRLSYTHQGLIDETLSILNDYKLSPEERRRYYLD